MLKRLAASQAAGSPSKVGKRRALVGPGVVGPAGEDQAASASRVGASQVCLGWHSCGWGITGTAPIKGASGTGGATGSDQKPLDDDEARILRQPIAIEQYQTLGARLRGGELVSFPTETVYGLGANGLDATAVLKIFRAKGRPLNDPCILHVPNVERALELLELSSLERAVFEALTSKIWPGPLSVVGRARSAVPKEVTAQTDFVAVRCPNHPVALELLRAANVPLAAPSANRFGHISPTRAEHVLEDLGHWRGLQILDGGACGVGIESTVAKLDLENRRVLVLRKGGATLEMLETALEEGFAHGAFGSERVVVEFYSRWAAGTSNAAEAESIATAPPGAPATKLEEDKKKEGVEEEQDEDKEAQQAPGMMLRHYAPSVPTYLLAKSDIRAGESPAEGATSALGEAARGVLVDFGGVLREHQHLFLRSFDLCASGPSHEEACRSVFAVLREAEAFAQANNIEVICLADFEVTGRGSYSEALHDRLFRAASGRSVALVGAGRLVAAAGKARR
mmetsp:Transcript_33178/g.93654  ORF Transcript_33178/g.93654 Transcript_33178/m.93654 type:complete len:511 (-) Transcript_33178:72-1604(-)